MSFRFSINNNRFDSAGRLTRALLGSLLIIILAACSSQGAREAELAAQEAARVAAEQEGAESAQEQQRQLAAEQRRQQELEAQDRARLQAQRDRQAEETRARAAEEQRQRDLIENRESERLAVIAAAEAALQGKKDHIAELERELVTLQSSAGTDENSTARLEEAILVAEELLEALTAEQAKYGNTDVNGNPVNPLAKDLIAELEARKDDLVRQAQSQ